MQTVPTSQGNQASPEPWDSSSRVSRWEEKWFCYWKTSASLWKRKIEEIPSPLFLVPLSWAFHFREEAPYDFANERPETNLKRIWGIAQDLNKEVVFLLPLVPAPFLANGGVPYPFARHRILGQDGLARLGAEAGGERIHRLYSFFDQKLFQAFSIFCGELASYFQASDMGANILGLDCVFFDSGRFRSYGEDYSPAFDEAFARFLEKKKEKEGLDLEEARGEFTNLTLDLYIQTAQDALGEHWGGVRDVLFLGGGPGDFFSLIANHQRPKDHSMALFSSLRHGLIPSTLLLPRKEKEDTLSHQLEHLASPFYLKSLVDAGPREEEQAGFCPLVFFDLYGTSEKKPWNDLGLALEETFPSLYRVIQGGHGIFSTADISFFEGCSLDVSSFQRILKMFMAQKKIVINREGIDSVLSKKFETFFLENNLPTEKVNYQTVIEQVSLGEGLMILFDGEALREKRKGEQVDFWHKILSLFSLKHLFISTKEGVDFFWEVRNSRPGELNYEEVRRLNLYNSTSYKKKISLKPTANSMALIKVARNSRVRLKHTPSAINMEFIPDAYISLDFGIYS